MIRILLSVSASMLVATGLSVAADKSSPKKAVVTASEKGKLDKLPFSPGILKGDTLYVAGQAGFGPNGRPDDFQEEVKMSLENVRKVLTEAGYDFSDVVTVNVYLTDIGMIEKMNEVYLKYFPVPRPARTTVGVQKLVSTARVEITVTARK